MISGASVSSLAQGMLLRLKLSITIKRKEMNTLTPIGPAANKPGEILRTEFLEPLGLTQNELAAKTGLDRMRISEIVRGRRAITALTAIALGKALRTGARFWMNLQTDYDLAVEAKKKSHPVRVILNLKAAKKAASGGLAPARVYSIKAAPAKHARKSSSRSRGHRLRK
jgi:antitoxin HigA-1